MDLRAAHSLRIPLCKGFKIPLNLRLPPPRQPLSHPRSTDPLMPTDAVRKAPHPPTEVDMTYILCKPLQTGPEYEGEVWLAQPCQPSSPGAPTSQVVLKFVKSSCLSRFSTELTEAMSLSIRCLATCSIARLEHTSGSKTFRAPICRTTTACIRYVPVDVAQACSRP
ncbi:hypothetical protein K466DRAFT_184530 [Polyporus arcularius HHB13444]|uniref:Uncharacterized protein n=1 Tax=Polyporus arcularius HHB13444 TaxID=1314778 RepID=A0A5C3PHX9_9APHY|nr:hypothetical protein K466DRAFT_184530 [Polyporus arcularius HHB13444]